MIKVKNINGLNTKQCSCESTFEHWKMHSNTTVTFCSEIYCLNKDIQGAYVQKVDNNEDWFVIPLCKLHCKIDEDITLVKTTVFIPVEETDLCEENLVFQTRNTKTRLQKR